MEPDAETTEQEVVPDAPDTENGEYEPATDAGASAGRVPSWVWVALGALAVGLVAVTLALVFEARDASTNAKAASASATQLLDELVADIKTTNVELAQFNEQFSSASASAQAKASSAQEKKSERSSSTGDSP